MLEALKYALNYSATIYITSEGYNLAPTLLHKELNFALFYSLNTPLQNVVAISIKHEAHAYRLKLTQNVSLRFRPSKFNRLLQHATAIGVLRECDHLPSENIKYELQLRSSGLFDHHLDHIVTENV